MQSEKPAVELPTEGQASRTQHSRPPALQLHAPTRMLLVQTETCSSSATSPRGLKVGIMLGPTHCRPGQRAQRRQRYVGCLLGCA